MAGNAFETLSAGSMVADNAGVADGHDVMNRDAREYTESCVSKGPFHGCCLRTAHDTHAT